RTDEALRITLARYCWSVLRSTHPAHPPADCDSGYGEIKFFYMDGKLAFKGDYVADGNSVGAGIGDFMCGVRIGLSSQKS
ncbi:hypothetical protein V4S92_20765, partial [Citrobacter freundii]